MTSARVVLLVVLGDLAVAGGLLALAFLGPRTGDGDGSRVYLFILLSLFLSLGAVGASIWAARRDRLGWLVAALGLGLVLASFYSCGMMG
jgi:hypothetical protein